ncbi:DUF7662 domain-containing protein [Pedococcus sp. 5OH_020]|uniref:DUF7662 domain-containing protein n=1 Tax=Pedococcus sp. 5OH_020 TaxID=2989814 RepID=UPI003FA68257
MADWRPLRALLTTVTDSVTLSWEDLDLLVGRLPPSAYNHAAFWKGESRYSAGRSTGLLDAQSRRPALLRPAAPGGGQGRGRTADLPIINRSLSSRPPSARVLLPVCGLPNGYHAPLASALPALLHGAVAL